MVGRYLFVLAGFLASSGFAAHGPDAADAEMDAALAGGVSSPQAAMVSQVPESYIGKPTVVQKLRVCAEALQRLKEDEKAFFEQQVAFQKNPLDPEVLRHATICLQVIEQNSLPILTLFRDAQTLEDNPSQLPVLLNAHLLGHLLYINERKNKGQIFCSKETQMSQARGHISETFIWTIPEIIEKYCPTNRYVANNCIKAHEFSCLVLRTFYQELKNFPEGTWPPNLKKALEASDSIRDYLNGKVTKPPIPDECLGDPAKYFTRLISVDRTGARTERLVEPDHPLLVHSKQSTAMPKEKNRGGKKKAKSENKKTRKKEKDLLASAMLRNKKKNADEQKTMRQKPSALVRQANGVPLRR